MERDTMRQVLTRMLKVRDALRQRLLAGTGSMTDFKRWNLQALSAEVDRLIADVTRDLADLANQGYKSAAGQGQDYAAEPVRAARLNIIQATPGADGQLVQAAFGNTVDLLTLPMQQFGTDVKVALRRVATAGENKFEELQRLRDKIGGQGFSNAQYRAERIIRTEINRVFNESTFQRLVSLGKEFPFLRKGWRYTKDSRTRNGHREAGQQYGRGSGIPIADLFVVNVYSGGRPGQAVKKIGVATMRFPVDPQAQPAGRLAAAATIMCRCNAFVDFDVADYAKYAAGKLANTGMVVPKPAPVPAPKPAPPAAPAPPKKLRKPRVPKPVFSAPLVPEPKKADIIPNKTGPQGAKIRDQFVQIYGDTTKARVKQVEDALAAMDSVHGLGTTPSKRLSFKLTSGTGSTFGELEWSALRGAPVELRLTKSGSNRSPMMTTWHETGHYLDTTLGGYRVYGSYAGQGVGRTVSSSWGKVALRAGGTFQKLAPKLTPEVLQAVQDWQTAVSQSQAYKELLTWRARGPGTPDMGGLKDPLKHLDYLLSTEEAWARSYAQYIAKKTGQGLDELNDLRKHVQPPGQSRGKHRMHPEADKETGGWEFPTQWDDADFQPIEEAFDRLFAVLGWRK